MALMVGGTLKFAPVCLSITLKIFTVNSSYTFQGIIFKLCIYFVTDTVNMCMWMFNGQNNNFLTVSQLFKLSHFPRTVIIIQFSGYGVSIINSAYIFFSSPVRKYRKSYCGDGRVGRRCRVSNVIGASN